MLQGSNLETACCHLPLLIPPTHLNLPFWPTLSNITFICPPSSFYHHVARLLWKAHNSPCCPVGFCTTWLSWGHHPGSQYLVPSCDFPENFPIASSRRVQEPPPMVLTQPHCKCKSFFSDYVVSGSAQSWVCLFLTPGFPLHTVSESCEEVSSLPCCFFSVLWVTMVWHRHLHHDAVRYKLMLFFRSSQEQTKHSHAVLMAGAAHTLTSKALTVKTCFRYAHVYFSIIYSENRNFQSDV